MQLRRFTSMLTALALAGAATVATTAPAQAGDRPEPGNRSLAAVLAADGGGFDHTAGDFDILDNAVRAVLAEKPKSPVRVLAKGRTRLTAFAPTDGAFRRLVADLTGERYGKERRVFAELATTAGIGTIEEVLLYHVVPGATLTYRQARAADGARLETALADSTLRVRVRDARVVLVDADRNDPNAKVIKKLRNLNKGNKQIAHGISQVLRPADL
jgi:uncharacterized surface protein with fasciclin (FAS1) repeats